MKRIIETNEANFQSEVLNSTLPVLVDFWAEGCGACKRLAPVLEEIAGEYAGRVKFAKVNVDLNPQLTAHCHIQSLPTMIYFANGLVHHQIVGDQSKEAIVFQLESFA